MRLTGLLPGVGKRQPEGEYNWEQDEVCDGLEAAVGGYAKVQWLRLHLFQLCPSGPSAAVSLGAAVL